MLTAKDIREVQFHRSMGGYKTVDVDAFLDACAETVEELTAQNEESKNKMQVLAETIVEYRNQEDSIRFALINAQRMAESVVKEAEEKATAILDEATAKAESVTEDADKMASTAREQVLADMEKENAELLRIRKEVADFKSKLLSLYREHLTLIGVLEDAPQEEEAPEESTVETTESDDIVQEAPILQEVIEAEDKSTAYHRVLPNLADFELKED